ncbi:hypothetical protein [Adlercreutzia sp. ZJ154]|uniref:hypothetical protein n=1 Tax=Adlercreutzia sp. ZJ154 TaxID=2709790 RepID=UPI0013ECC45E|nr:hypothetical protein [Adlercreutzia sp. ZJ154]
MKLVSCFVDETGQQDMRAGYYMLTLVFHDQSESIAPMINAYEQRIALEDIPDLPFHAVDLLHGHEAYERLSVEQRKRLLVAFSMLVRTLPVSYKTFTYSASDVKGKEELQARMRKDIVNFLFDHLEKFQQFDKVPIYYDGGHKAVTDALHAAFDYVLAKDVAVYKNLSHQEKCLAQTADYLCTIELAAMKYGDGAESQTYLRFFGKYRNFKQNFLKQVRRKLIK